MDPFEGLGGKKVDRRMEKKLRKNKIRHFHLSEEEYNCFCLTARVMVRAIVRAKQLFEVFNRTQFVVHPVAELQSREPDLALILNFHLLYRLF